MASPLAAQPLILLDYDGAGAYVGRNRHFIRRLVAQRRLAYYRVGRRVLFDPQDLDVFLDAARVEAAQRARPTPRRPELSPTTNAAPARAADRRAA